MLSKSRLVACGNQLLTLQVSAESSLGMITAAPAMNRGILPSRSLGTARGDLGLDAEATDPRSLASGRSWASRRIGRSTRRRMASAVLLGSMAFVPCRVMALEIASPAVTAQSARSPAAAASEAQAFEAGRNAYHSGNKAAALTALQLAADQGHTGAKWMLGRMYAEGDGVSHDDLKAFDYFREVVRRASASEFDSPEGQSDGPYVSSALVWLGSYYLEGIPGSKVKPNPTVAFRLFSDAAYNFGDANAQYNLARMFLEGNGVQRDNAQALRWLNLAAQKSHAPSRALLGHILFKGELVPRQASRGLMLMTLARESAEKSGDPADHWMIELHEKALAQASEDERSGALGFLERWLGNIRR